MNLDLVSYVNLKDINNGQSIYSSQLYGTFFMIYGVFDSSYNKDTNTYTIKSIQLKIMNYKGIVNLAIIEAFLEPELGHDGRTTNYSLKVEVQAKLTTDKNDTELFSVKNCEGAKITKENTIILERFLKPIHQVGNEENYPALQNGVFDEEFFYREGEIKQENKKKQFKPRTMMEQANESTPANSYSGLSCPFSWLWFF